MECQRIVSHKNCSGFKNIGIPIQLFKNTKERQYLILQRCNAELQRTNCKKRIQMQIISFQEEKGNIWVTHVQWWYQGQSKKSQNKKVDALPPQIQLLPMWLWCLRWLCCKRGWENWKSCWEEYFLWDWNENLISTFNQYQENSWSDNEVEIAAEGTAL